MTHLAIERVEGRDAVDFLLLYTAYARPLFRLYRSPARVVVWRRREYDPTIGGDPWACVDEASPGMVRLRAETLSRVPAP